MGARRLPVSPLVRAHRLLPHFIACCRGNARHSPPAPCPDSRGRRPEDSEERAARNADESALPSRCVRARVRACGRAFVGMGATV
jgi:hypothetical protein